LVHVIMPMRLWWNAIIKNKFKQFQII
jgi:hypothetical protein